MERKVDHAKEAIRIIDEALAEEDRKFAEIKAETDDSEEAERLFYNWVKYGRSVVTEADVIIEGSPDTVIYDPNPKSVLD